MEYYNCTNSIHRSRHDKNLCLQFPPSKAVSIRLPRDRFKLQKKNGQGKCPNDHLLITGIDESAVGTFPDDAEAEVDQIKVCGKLSMDYTFTLTAAQTLFVEFKANDGTKFKGFIMTVCVDP